MKKRNTLKEKFKKPNFTHKLFLANFLIIVILYFCVITISGTYYLSKETARTRQSLNTLTENITSQMNSMLYSADTLALQIASSPTVVNLFSNLSGSGSENNIFQTDPFLRKEITDFLTSYNFKDSLATRISLYKPPHYVSAGYITDYLSIQAFFASDNYSYIQNHLESGEHKNLFIAPRKDSFYIGSTYQSPSTLFSVVRGIKNPSLLDAPVLGYVEVQLDFERISSLFSNLDSSISGYIIDSSGNLIYPYSEAPRAYSSLNITENNCFLSKSEVREADLTVVLTQNKDYLYRNLYTTIGVMAAAFIGIIFITSIFLYLLTRHFTRPLIQLQNSLSQVTLENLELNLIPGTNNDTVEQLNTAFMNLLEHLKASMHETIAARTAEVESHFLALQAQINPHFFHNILTVISAIASEHDVNEIEGICSRLSNMLRFSTSYKQRVCTIKEELLYAENYMDLMACRYEGMFFSQCNIEPECRKVTIPKLIVQPLLENAFQHGFQNTSYPWLLEVDAYISEGYWHIDIQDNGCGFSGRFLKDFSEKIKNLDIYTIEKELKNLEIGGLSLLNVYCRMKYYYSDHMIFKLTNPPEGGALINLGGKIDD